MHERTKPCVLSQRDFYRRPPPPRPPPPPREPPPPRLPPLLRAGALRPPPLGRLAVERLDWPRWLADRVELPLWREPSNALLRFPVCAVFDRAGLFKPLLVRPAPAPVPARFAALGVLARLPAPGLMR